MTEAIDAFNELFEVLIEIKGEKISRSEEADIEDEIDELLDTFHKKSENNQSLSAKFNFVRAIDFLEEYEE